MSDIELNDFANSDFSEFVNLLEESHECPICLESFNLASNNLIKTCCNHYYCKPCYNKINECGLCRTSFNKTQLNIQPNILSNTQTNTQPNFRLNFNHPVSELIFLSQYNRFSEIEGPYVGNSHSEVIIEEID